MDERNRVKFLLLKLEYLYPVLLEYYIKIIYLKLNRLANLVLVLVGELLD
jgi:hypothetical protein